MNKVVAVLGIIVLLTLAMLFFCIGFFTGSTVTPESLVGKISAEIKKENIKNPLTKEAIAQKLGDIGDVKSAKISDKIMNILATAGYTVESISEMVKSKPSTSIKPSDDDKKKFSYAKKHLTVDSLLREMAVSHSTHDDCSYEKTIKEVSEREPGIEQTLEGKKVVFIGYFKNNIAVQIQKLLASKGYKTHVEVSNDGQDSFVFCGPFKKDATANNLLKWLQRHDFTEARVVSVSKEAIEETLYDAMNDGVELPVNEENAEMNANTVGTSGVKPVAAVPAVIPAPITVTPATKAPTAPAVLPIGTMPQTTVTSPAIPPTVAH